LGQRYFLSGGLQFIVPAKEAPMRKFRCSLLTAAVCVAAVTLAACGREGQDEMRWARAALERNSVIEMVAAAAPTATAMAEAAAPAAPPGERRHEPIVCQGSRLVHIDNRNLAFDGDAVSAEDGCEIHITNSHITATGVGVSARAANVHVDNSLIEGGQAAIDASQGAQVYTASSRFKGLSRRLDSATVHDLGGNVWH